MKTNCPDKWCPTIAIIIVLLIMLVVWACSSAEERKMAVIDAGFPHGSIIYQSNKQSCGDDTILAVRDGSLYAIKVAEGGNVKDIKPILNLNAFCSDGITVIERVIIPGTDEQKVQERKVEKETDSKYNNEGKY